MALAASLFEGKVMHKRLFPKVNQFTYGIYYLVLPLSELRDGRLEGQIALNRFGAVSFYTKDHGARGGDDLEGWVRGILADYGFNEIVSEIVLVAMPRVLGYVFNPVSFWLCLNAEKQIVAVVSEVNNTFGETHSYLCAHPDFRPIGGDDWMESEKLFHVSPFLEREGRYQFRFSLVDEKLGVWIDFYDADGNKQLLTSLTGTLVPLSRRALYRTFFAYPLVTLKAIMLIHWQALKLLIKGIKYIPKPVQVEPGVSASQNLTKM